ncbi:fibronectin type III domain-containing protein, partial [Clostridium sp.]|uniref:fibronectin type III domain-containing protein n=1 Tax=Clostridium sp. TaxID=1506 RepID=UPI003F32791E
ITVDKMKEAFNNIKDSKENLMKRDGNIPTVTATDSTYTHSGAAWQGPYFPPEKYAVERIVDGDVNTKAWFADNQNVGDEIVFSFAEKLNMSEIKIINPADVGEDFIVKADVEVATQKGQWTKVGEITNDGAKEKTISFEKTPVQFVRIVIKQNVNKWYQIAEVNFTYDQIQESNVLRDMILEAEELDIKDKDLTLVSNMVDALINAQKAYVEGIESTETIEKALRDSIEALEVEIEIVVSKPLNLNGEVSSDEVILNWDEPKEATGLESYIVYMDGKVVAEIPATENTFTATKLKANTIYGFKVVSKYSNGEKSKPVSINIRTIK